MKPKFKINDIIQYEREIYKVVEMKQFRNIHNSFYLIVNVDNGTRRIVSFKRLHRDGFVVKTKKLYKPWG